MLVQKPNSALNNLKIYNFWLVILIFSNYKGLLLPLTVLFI